MWMCAAIALPVSLENRSRHATVPPSPSFATVAVKLPVARLTLPFGFGTSWRDESRVATVAVVASWPRISPPLFVTVCTFTYAVPAWTASTTAWGTVPVPLAGLEHGPQSASTTGPGDPTAPVWMCAAMASPVSPLNDSCHETDAPVSDLVTVAENVPPAFATAPVGDGTSCAAFRIVRI